MSSDDKLKLVAPCGLYCGGCLLYKACTDKVLAEKIAQRRGVSVEELPVCLGCRPHQGCVPSMGGAVCATYACVNQRKLEFCYECKNFPCLKLAPAADRAQEIPHNNKIYNLLLLQKWGLENWLKRADELWMQYYRGKKPHGGDELVL